MAKNLIVVLSDLHIANDAPTVWYQSSVHNRYLDTICKWIVKNASSVRELVLLGDVVDFWTHPANVQPPSFAQIVAAQPAIFGPRGFFCQVMDALDGAVTYVPGNHDMGVKAADVARIVSAGGHKMKFVEGVYYPLGPQDHRVALAHGNAYTMFNAEDSSTAWAPLPVGHFITRMVASMWARKLQPGQTVADLPNQGSPNGMDFTAIIKGIIASGTLGVTKALLDSVAAQTGTPHNQTFILPGGRVVALDKDVYPAYDNLFSKWVVANGGGEAGLLIAGKSALADALAYYMGWFAQRQAFQSGAQAIVLGHTHTPISGVDTTILQYANSGFECPSIPDMPPQAVNFGVVNTDNMKTQVMVATSQGRVDPFAAGRTPIVEMGADFSCYVIIENTGSDPLMVKSLPAPGRGHWVVPPPKLINPGARATCWVQDYPGPFGSEGKVVYWSVTRGDQTFSFECPTGLFSNACSGGKYFTTKSGAGDWGPPGHVAKGGHPFYVHFRA